VLSRSDVANQPPVVGDLRVEEMMDRALGRYLRMARLRSDDGHAIGTSLVPDLYDVHLISMSPSAFSLTGIERVDSAEFAQSWLVTTERSAK
jgi:hypothetical protein